jgi:hypothetical protein
LWWSTADFSAFSQADKQLVEDLTGGIPLLLGPFSGHPGKSLADLEPEIWDMEILACVEQTTYRFAIQKTKHELFKS